MKRVKIMMATSGYIYRGKVERENEDYITIHDDYTNHEVTINKQHAAIIEEIGDKND